jgi:hypothetical protein
MTPAGRGRPRKYPRHEEPRSRGRAGAPTVRERWASSALEGAVRAGLESVGATGVQVPPKWTMRAACVTLLLQGLDQHEVGRRLNLRVGAVRVHAHYWRKAKGLTVQEFNGTIAANVSARRKKGPAILEPLGSPKPAPEVPPLDVEMMQFVHDIGDLAVMHELAAQGRPMTQVQLDALPDSVYCRLITDAKVREANARFYGGEPHEQMQELGAPVL